MILTNAKERSRFIRFAIVGAAGAVIDFGVFNFLTNLVGYFKENVVWASVISFILAVISNFTWNRLWTYPDSRSKPLARQLTQFVAVSVIGFAHPHTSFLSSRESLDPVFHGPLELQAAHPGDRGPQSGAGDRDFTGDGLEFHRQPLLDL